MASEVITQRGHPPGADTRAVLRAAGLDEAAIDAALATGAARSAARDT